MPRIDIPQYAKENARKGLSGQGYGTDKGRYRARYLIENTSMSQSVAEEVKNFLKRFHGMAARDGYTDNILGALYLWGGQQNKRFLNYLQRKNV